MTGGRYPPWFIFLSNESHRPHPPAVLDATRTKEVCGRAPEVESALRPCSQISARRRSHELDGEVGRRFSSIRPRGAGRAFLRRRRPSLHRFLPRRHRSDDRTFPIRHGESRGRADAPRHYAHAPWRRRHHRRRGIAEALQPSVLAIRADRDRRESFLHPAGTTDYCASENLGLQLVLSRHRRRILHQSRRGWHRRSSALETSVLPSIQQSPPRSSNSTMSRRSSRRSLPAMSPASWPSLP